MISIIDFDDSFTYNIASEFKLVSPKTRIEVINKKQAQNHLLDVSQSDTKQVVVLGPGPGHPEQYDYLHPVIKEVLLNPKVFVFGICLGHQIMGRLQGFNVQRCREPVHGKTKNYKISEKWQSRLGLPASIEAQSYNSLAVVDGEGNSALSVDKLVQNDEIFMFAEDGLLTYQFHPESIGTKYRPRFFQYASSFLI